MVQQVMVFTFHLNVQPAVFRHKYGALFCDPDRLLVPEGIRVPPVLKLNCCFVPIGILASKSHFLDLICKKWLAKYQLLA
jgi:hypothetical protein